MNLEFSKIIRSMEIEIAFQYIPGAIRWCDDNCENAWSKAIDRFDNSLRIAIERKDYQLIKIESEFYQNMVLDLLSKYKSFKNIDESKNFLEAIAPMKDLGNQ